jgi:Asp/Glu/hydantoin racemase
MHVSEVIDNAFRAEREGYDAFCLGGTLDLGAVYLREVLDIPVAFIAESSFHIACLLARKFSIITVNEGMLRRQMELVRDNGLEERCIPGVHMSTTMLEVVELFSKDPQRVVDMFFEGAEKVIAQGAGALVPGFGAISSFFGQRGIHGVNTVPIIDITAAVIKSAELLVDLHRAGIKRSRKGIYNYPSKEELMAARKLYGFE